VRQHRSARATVLSTGGLALHAGKHAIADRIASTGGRSLHKWQAKLCYFS